MCTGPGSGQGQSPRILIASGIFVGSYRAVPVASYLGVDGLFLKGVGERFQPLGERLDPAGDLGVGPAGGMSVRPSTIWSASSSAGEQQLPRFAEGAEAGQRLAALGVDQPGRRP